MGPRRTLKGKRVPALAQEDLVDEADERAGRGGVGLLLGAEGVGACSRLVREELGVGCLLDETLEQERDVPLDDRCADRDERDGRLVVLSLGVVHVRRREPPRPRGPTSAWTERATSRATLGRVTSPRATLPVEFRCCPLGLPPRSTKWAFSWRPLRHTPHKWPERQWGCQRAHS